MKTLFVLLLSLAIFATPARALSLFGLDLASAGRNDMRTAVTKSGAEVIRHGSKGELYDVYRAQKLLPGAQKLYLGYDPDSQRWAFTEYEFNGLRHPAIVNLLSGRYGDPSIEQARFVSDTAYRWTVDGVEIEIYKDWAAYKTRLVYRNPSLTEQLRASFARSGGAQSTGIINLEAAPVY